MCGRFSLTVDQEALTMRFAPCTLVTPYQPRFNIAPGQTVTAVIASHGTRRIGQLFWGLAISGLTSGKSAGRIINARAETLAVKATFRDSLLYRRCLIPADGFFEWPKTENNRLPLRFTRQDSGVMALAGIYEPFLDTSGTPKYACAIITTPPNELIGAYHNRMPAILSQDQENIWLQQTEQDPDRLLALLRPYPANLMRGYRVSALVNNVKNDCPECIEPIPSRP